MRSAVDLVDLPYSFSQRALLTEEDFVRQARDRGVLLSAETMAAFHRMRLLVPLLRVRRDGRAVANAARSDPHRARQLGHVRHDSLHDLIAARASGRLFAPSNEGFSARHRLRRVAGPITYVPNEFLYSQHQLMHVRKAQEAIPLLRRGGRGSLVAPDLSGWWLKDAQASARQLELIVVAVSALEPVFLPDIVRVRRSRLGADDGYDRWSSTLAPQWLLTWLEVDASWVRDAAARLLTETDRFDPLGGWFSLVREADPSTWESLRGHARSAIDFRVAAEVLLRYYDTLVRAELADPLPERAQRTKTAFDGRLQSRGHVDDLLTRFGLSPHPRLLLVVEGATERLLFPRLMRRFGIRTDPGFIAIEDAEGIDRDLTSLVAYAVAPRTELDDDGRYLRLLRPPTRLLMVADAEGRMTTRQQRDKRASDWVDRLMRTLPAEHRTHHVRSSIELLVAVDTWNGRDSFEFAHFDDREIAEATAALDDRERRPRTLEARIAAVKSLRASRGNVKELLPDGFSKRALADVLWPILDSKIEAAQRDGTEVQIPIVRLLDRATDLATEFPHRNLVLALGPR